MALDLQQQRREFPARSGGPQVLPLIFTFPTTLLRAAVAINGFEIEFTNDEHPVLKTTIDAAVITVTGGTMTVEVTFAIRDNSDTFDDPFKGYVDVLAIVDRA